MGGAEILTTWHMRWAMESNVLFFGVQTVFWPKRGKKKENIKIVLTYHGLKRAN